MNKDNLLFVSVIVPVFNDEKRIGKCIESLLSQTYPKDKFEIIIVDNNSYDKTIKIIKEYSVKILHENNIQSSYAARNKGIKNAQGEVLAFTDSDCIIDKNWILNSVNYFAENKCDLIAGDVKFFYKNKNNLFEILDSFIHFNQKEGVLKNKVPTANLFIKKYVFDKIGFFNFNLKSGADLLLTNKAVKAGYRLCFSSESMVYHPTRNFKELVLKHKRIAYDNIPSRLQRGEGILSVIFHLFIDFFPQKKFFCKKIKDLNYNENRTALSIKLFFANWLILSITNFYKFVYLKNLLISKLKKNEKN
ncbi:MAG: glycosyltransferase [Aliarcobacter skirrowii]|nr:glycosyltransferase [Aliarcobacter skirrowii]MDD2509475.1 glycosyltransferase [Aliarcobacter skirrowii]